nr:zinc finger, CCHC-type [Tanacetum cinerariifolium]
MAGNTVKDMTTNFGKLDKFEGYDFRRWQKKMHVLLTTLNVVYVLITSMPKLLEDAMVEAIRIRAKSCRIHSNPCTWKRMQSKKFLESDKGKGKEVAGPSVNMTEEGKNKHNKQNKGKKGPMRTTVVLVPTRNQNWNVGSVVRLVTSKGIAVVVDAIAWQIDSGATNHVCKDHCWFKTYEQVEDESVLYMGDDHFTPVHGKGSVALEFSSGKTITLFNVFYVPKLRKNLVSGPMLNKCGYKQVYESDKLFSDEYSMDLVEKLKPNTGKHVDQLEYSKAIRCLMYAMTSTRHDIAYAISRLRRFTSNPSRQHWQAITRVFKYLKGTMNYGLSYVGYPLVLEGYSDASWINHVEDSSSTSGWMFLLRGRAISWASKKQTCITGSTMKSKFVALAAAGKEAEWLRNLIHEIPIWPKPIAPISINCDSAATLAKAYSQMYNGKSRHLGVAKAELSGGNDRFTGRLLLLLEQHFIEAPVAIPVTNLSSYPDSVKSLFSYIFFFQASVNVIYPASAVYKASMCCKLAFKLPAHPSIINPYPVIDLLMTVIDLPMTAKCKGFKVDQGALSFTFKIILHFCWCSIPAARVFCSWCQFFIFAGVLFLLLEYSVPAVRSSLLLLASVTAVKKIVIVS